MDSLTSTKKSSPSPSRCEARGEPTLHLVPRFAPMRIIQRTPGPPFELPEPLLVGRQAEEQLLGKIEALVIRQRHCFFEDLASAVGHIYRVPGAPQISITRDDLLALLA